MFTTPGFVGVTSGGELVLYVSSSPKKKKKVKISETNMKLLILRIGLCS